MRDRLIQTAAELVAEGGVRGLSMRALAVACDTSTNAIYTLFGGRPQLLRHVLKRAAVSFTAVQSDALQGKEDPVTELLNLGHAYYRWALENPAFYVIMIQGRIAEGDDDPIWEVPEGMEDPMNPLLRSIRACIEGGYMIDSDHLRIALSLWSHVHGSSSLSMFAQRVRLPDEYAQQMFEDNLQHVTAGWLTEKGLAHMPGLKPNFVWTI
ncbi:MAG: TetR/AcrR family transcriptional regulator [Nocardioides sp.]